jgi:hypothetical protein
MNKAAVSSLYIQTGKCAKVSELAKKIKVIPSLSIYTHFIAEEVYNSIICAAQ